MIYHIFRRSDRNVLIYVSDTCVFYTTIKIDMNEGLEFLVMISTPYMLTMLTIYRQPVDTLPWRRNERDGVSNHQPRDCLFNRLFRRKSKKTSKLRVTGLCEGNSPVTGEFPAQRASNAEMFRFHDVIMNHFLRVLTSYSEHRVKGNVKPVHFFLLF